jgi:outer membrane protein assembly factor BamD (BamD/ComL family)
LLAGFTAQAKSIGEPHVRQALASISGEEGLDAKAAEAPALLSTPRVTLWWKIGGGAGILAVLLLIAWFALDGRAEFLAMRAARSSSATNAERDYERIARLHAGSRQRENALLRLAQFQLARGSHQAALQSLATLGREYGAGRTAVERQLWTASAQLASGDTAAACASAKGVTTATPTGTPPDFAAMTRECSAYVARADSARLAASRAPSAGVPPDSAR